MSHLKYCPVCGGWMPFKGNLCPSCQAGLDQSQSTSDNFFVSGEEICQSQNSVLFVAGDIIGDRYKIIRPLIGSDSVFLVEDQMLGEVVLKIMFEGPEEVLTCQLKDNPIIPILMKLSGKKHLIHIYDFFQTSYLGRSLILQSMEYCNGVTLRQFMQMFQDQTTRLSSGLPFLIQLCEGLNALHQKNIFHLDLRPENLLLSEDGLKICDFGILQYSFNPEDKGDIFSRRITHKISSPVYMSPELSRASRLSEVDHRVDIYALGIVMLEFFHGGCMPSYWGASNGLAGAYGQLLNEIEAPIQQIIGCCLQENPDDRFVDIHELTLALETLSVSGCESVAINNEHADRPRVDELSKSISRAQALYECDQFNEALQILNAANSQESPEIKVLMSKIGDRKIEAEKIYSYIEDNLEGGVLCSLADMLQEATDVFPDHPHGGTIQLKLLSMAKAYNEAIDAGNLFMDHEDWEGALEAFNRALFYEKHEPRIKRIVAILIKITDWRNDIDKALENEDFDKARSLACLVDDLVERLPRNE